MIHSPLKCIAGEEINLTVSRAGKGVNIKELEEHGERGGGKMIFKIFSPAAFMKCSTLFYGSNFLVAMLV